MTKITRAFLGKVLGAAGLLTALPALAAETVSTSNPYGIDALWSQGDFVAKGTLIILLIMSRPPGTSASSSCWNNAA